MKLFFASLVALVVASVPAFAQGYSVANVRTVVVSRPAVVQVVRPVVRSPYSVGVGVRAGCCHFKRVVLPCGTVTFVRVCY